MSTQSDTHFNNLPISVYEWIIDSLDTYNPTTYGIVATSVEQARNLLILELERQLPFDGITLANLHFIGPYTNFVGSVDRLYSYNEDNIPYRSISRTNLEAALANPPYRVVPIVIGTTVLFSALDC